MYDLFVNWLNLPDNVIDNDIFYFFFCIAAFMFLLFIFDIIRLIFYYIVGDK